MRLLVRYLLAVAFAVLCVSGAFMWTIGQDVVPWWTPFALAVGVPAVVGGCILIAGVPLEESR